MRVILSTRPDGGLDVTNVPADTDAAIAEALKEYPFAKNSNVQIVEDSVIPPDRTFRRGLRQNGSNVVFDMPACREIHRSRLRELRRPLFTEIDAAIRDAQIDGDNAKLATAIARRNALRDVTADPRIEAARTPEELKAVVPQILNTE